MVEEIVVGREDAVREPVVAHESPDVLDGVQLGALGWERHEGDAREVPSGPKMSLNIEDKWLTALLSPLILCLTLALGLRKPGLVA